MLPVATALGREFRDAFGVPVIPDACSPEQLTIDELTQYDFMMTDDRKLIEKLTELGVISATTAFANTTPALIMRKSDNLAILKVDDLAVPREQPLRLTLATRNTTLYDVVMPKLKQLGLSSEKDTPLLLIPYFAEEISSDGTRQHTTPASMLQQLRDKETDIIVSWDFVAAEALSKQKDADDFVVVNWPKETGNTIMIPLCLTKDCREYTNCRVFVNFVKSNHGREILRSRFITPADELIGTY
jgi:ABC-type molybdate transport system, periplasmic component